MSVPAPPTGTAGSPSAPAMPPGAMPDSREVRRVPFALLLSLVVGLPIVLAVLIVLGISSYSGFTSALSLVAQRTDLLLSAAENKVRAHLDPAAATVATLVARIESDDDLRAGGARLDDLFAGALAGLGGRVEVFALLRPDASVVAVQRSNGGAEAIRMVTDVVSIDSLRADFEAGRIDAPVWDEVRVLPLSGVTLNVHMAVRDAAGGFAGVLAATVPVSALSEFMRDMEMEVESDRAYLLAADGTVVAHTLLAGQPSPGEHAPVSVAELGDPVLARLTERRPVSIPFFEEIAMSRVAVGELDFMVLERQLAEYGPAPLTLGVYFERKGPPQELLRVVVSAGLGAGVLLVAVLVSLVLGRAAARPLRLLASNAHAIGVLDLDRVQALPASRVTEFDEQARAFNAMTTSLRWFETYVPKRLVHRLVDTGAEVALVSRERELSILFTDIAGFTTLSERMPAGTVAALLNEHFRLIAGAVDAEDGTIDKFIGDGLMAFWGAPEADPDHALKAFRALAAIAVALDRDNVRRRRAGEPPILVRGGLHTGRVVVGNIGAPGRMNYTVVGDPVNVASRLEQAGRTLAPAEHGDGDGDDDAAAPVLLISKATVEAVRAAVDRRSVDAPLPVAPLGPQTLEGRQARLEGYRLVTERAAAWLALIDTTEAPGATPADHADRADAPLP